MSIATAITALSGRIQDAYDALEAKGATIPEVKNTANLSVTIDSIEIGAKEVYGIKSVAQIIGVPDADGTLVHDETNQFAFKLDGISSIPTYSAAFMFFNNSSISSAELPDLTYVDTYGMESIFRQCKNLKSLSMPKLKILSTNYAAARMLDDNINLTSIHLPELECLSGTNCMQSFAAGCQRLTSVSFPKLHTATGTGVFSSTFSGCSSLQYAEFPHLSSLIGGTQTTTSMFAQCSSLSTVNFDSLQYASFYQTFQNSGLKTISFPQLISVDNLGYAFKNCSSLVSASFPVLTSIIGDRNNIAAYAFQNCTKLSSVEFPELQVLSGSQAATQMFDGCSHLLSVSLPKLVEIGGPATGNNSAGYNMFYNCYNLSSVSLPKLSAINGIGAMSQMFLNTKVTSLTLPELQTLGGRGGLQGNRTIREIYLPKLESVPSSHTNLFANCNELTAIHFAAVNQATIEASPQYNTLFGRGAGAATVYFDL